MKKKIEKKKNIQKEEEKKEMSKVILWGILM
jgi:hypothetical protein